MASDGSLWMLDKWGYVWTAAGSGSGGTADEYRLSDEPLHYMGPGRPLGFHFDAAGDLVVCDTKGLMLLERGGTAGAPLRQRCLANSAGGRPIAYANDLDISEATGAIFFSDSSIIPPALNAVPPRPWFDTLRSYLLTSFHGEATGRLLRHDRDTGGTEVLADGLFYANGVALAQDESFVAVVETCSMRVRRYWLTGPQVRQCM